MGLSVWNQVDNERYFCLSSINKKELERHSINIPLTQFKEIVRRTAPHIQIMTGSDRAMGRRRMTNIYRYEDFTNTLKQSEGA